MSDITANITLYVEFPQEWVEPLTALARKADEENGADPLDSYTPSELIAILVNDTTLFNFSGTGISFGPSTAGWSATPQNGWETTA